MENMVHVPTNYDLLLGLVLAREKGCTFAEVVDDVFAICERLGHSGDNFADYLLDDMIESGELLYDVETDMLSTPD